MPSNRINASNGSFGVFRLNSCEDGANGSQSNALSWLSGQVLILESVQRKIVVPIGDSLNPKGTRSQSQAISECRQSSASNQELLPRVLVPSPISMADRVSDRNT